jgi:predicted nucleotidyltransferase
VDGIAKKKPALVADPIFRRFRAGIDELYGDRAEHVVLFGSRARGDHRPDSDYDIAVFIRDLDSLFEENRRLAQLGTKIFRETGADLVLLPLRAEAYRERTAFMAELRRDGIDL